MEKKITKEEYEYAKHQVYLFSQTVKKYEDENPSKSSCLFEYLEEKDNRERYGY